MLPLHEKNRGGGIEKSAFRLNDPLWAKSSLNGKFGAKSVRNLSENGQFLSKLEHFLSNKYGIIVNLVQVFECLSEREPPPRQYCFLCRQGVDDSQPEDRRPPHSRGNAHPSRKHGGIPRREVLPGPKQV